MMMISDLRGRFSNPDQRFRSLPFWAWNDELQEAELRRQIDEMQEQGMGGFFMHSRDGLETEYLGEAWMEAIRASVHQAEKNGMKAWIYDEDRWPSGTAGGRVPGKGDEYRAKGLTLETRRDSIPEDERIVAAFIARIEGLSIEECKRIPLTLGASPELSDQETLLVFRIEVSEPSEWFNDEAPPDHLNPDTVREFIAESYEPYKSEVGEHFGTTIAGVFTDEPSVHDRHCTFTPGRGWIPWTYTFADFFEARRGYDLLDVVPYIYYDGNHSAMARHDYWRTLTERFCEVFTKQLSEWCSSNKLAFTGHYLWENALGVATRTGGAIMPHYRYQDMPGIDMLCEQTDEHLTVKQCTSVANQYDRKFVLTETYGCAGWAFTFEGQKWIGDWQYALGVNVRSQHLAMYSIRGCRKRDYPPFFGYQTSWWKYANVIENYFARIGAVMTEGRAIRDVLVLHPASTAWSMLGTNPHGSKRRGLDRNIKDVDRYGDEFNDMLRVLLGEHYDFDLGDETIMAEAGRVQEQKLVIQEASYDLVIIPPITTMLESTYELLLKFLDQGGQAIALTPRATMLEGRVCEKMSALYNHQGMTVFDDIMEAVSHLESIKQRPVSIRTRDGREATQLLYLFKQVADGYTLFIVNNDRERAYDVTIETLAVGHVEEWNPLTGTIQAADASVCNGRLRIHAEFGPADAKLYTIRNAGTTESGNAAADTAPKLHTRTLAQAFGPSFRFARTAPNVLTLDSCEYRIADGEWSEKKEVWVAQQEIRVALGMRPIYYNGITQRYKWIHEAHLNNGTPIALRLMFQVDVVPEGDVKLVIEGAGLFRIWLNGQELSNNADGWFVDRSMDTVPLKGIQRGWNTLELTCDYTHAMEIEDCYIIGDFGVNPARTIVAEPERLVAGDWTLQGYFHYNGSMIYKNTFDYSPHEGERIELYVGEFSAVVIEVRVNGKTAGMIPWKAADGIDLTDFLQEGSNLLEVEVMGSPRNMFGPFHTAEGHPKTTSWGSFRTTGRAFTPDYIVHPYGIMGQMKLMSVRDH